MLVGLYYIKRDTITLDFNAWFINTRYKSHTFFNALCYDIQNLVLRSQSVV